MRLLAFIGIALVAGSAFAGKPKSPTPKSEAELLKAKSEAVIQAAEAIIAGRLKDPESARFRNVYVPAKAGNVCGEVNSKNSMGGYVGFQKFLIEDGNVIFADDGPSFPGLIEMACLR